MPRICSFPRVEGLGGVASFRLKFEQALGNRGVDVTNNLNEPADAVLILAGTRRLIALQRARRRGQRIVQRLDGINWVHRARWAGVRYTIRAIYGNWNLSFIRRRLADRVIYQSRFIKGWWEDWYGAANVPASVILNGAITFHDTRVVRLYFAPRNKSDLAFEGNMWVALDSSYAVRKIELGVPRAINLNWVSDLVVAQEFDWEESTDPAIGTTRRLMLSQDVVGMHFGVSDLFMVAMFPILIFLAARNTGAMSRLLDRPFFQKTGEHSYSIYMIHVPLMSTFLVGWLMFRAEKSVGVDNASALALSPAVAWGACVGYAMLVLSLSSIGYSPRRADGASACWT